MLRPDACKRISPFMCSWNHWFYIITRYSDIKCKRGDSAKDLQRDQFFSPSYPRSMACSRVSARGCAAWSLWRSQSLWAWAHNWSPYLCRAGSLAVETWKHMSQRLPQPHRQHPVVVILYRLYHKVNRMCDRTEPGIPLRALRACPWVFTVWLCLVSEGNIWYFIWHLVLSLLYRTYCLCPNHRAVYCMLYVPLLLMCTLCLSVVSLLLCCCEQVKESSLTMLTWTSLICSFSLGNNVCCCYFY